ncbi:hypothetical protein SAMN05216351_10380 [Pseudobutyrivibrio sp. JW11]|uniref:hypothetical protein n=1 Tax=Pseudobutyrivibrio sp. JW11 TaxID=1855302 RepID=UPI0008EC28F2|nr:hypothetical protein [Pseudobutyrivibrio sp. JW11]SFO08702.1 hypothetical protein SAMN05216351_10380 [Pseudobutyrivibrio sp. JW11]
MKRKKYMAIVMMVLVASTMVGCNENASENVSESIVENAAEYTGEDATEQSTDSTEDNIADSVYADVESGNAKVEYTGKGDSTVYLELSQVLTESESYTIDEICEALNQIEDFQNEVDITYSIIDCGSDGESELLVEAQLSAMYSLDMIIKKVDDKYVICYARDNSDRATEKINEDGTIERYFSSAYNIHDTEYSFVDAAGEYKFYYGVTETLSLFDTYDIYEGDSKISISTEGLDAEHIAVQEYYFEENYDDREYFYSFYTFDDNYGKVETEEGKADLAELGVRFKDEGYLVYDQDGIDAVLRDREDEIGYTKL